MSKNLQHMSAVVQGAHRIVIRQYSLVHTGTEWRTCNGAFTTSLKLRTAQFPFTLSARTTTQAF